MAQPKKKNAPEYDALDAFKHAEGIQQSCNAIGWIMVEWRKRGGDVKESVAPFLPSLNTLNALAGEVYLKCLAKLHGNTLTGHKLKDDLYDKLPKGVRDVLSQRFCTIAESHPQLRKIKVAFIQRGVKPPNYSIKDTLEQNNDNFVTWRYLFEEGKDWGMANHVEILNAAVRQMILEMKPEWVQYAYDNRWAQQLDKHEKPSMKFPIQ